ncbi:unnamed protein product [Psylliodes chrysocephalus]|uniref:Peptidase S1 domain-containing protein n=1 Tax=Psylliodes chrysocephalus TaxID=3402493 RepID=A0A9P0CIR4_9CUCU|nr:unnamed protein product [Psylliodes chrysocephala]
MFSAKVLFLAAVAVCYGAPNTKITNLRLGLHGATDAKIEDYPFMASLQYCLNKTCYHVCGGVIIKDRWILAGVGFTWEASKAVVGASNLHGHDKVIVDIEAVFRHPNYSRDFQGPNDVGLFKLSEALTFNDKVQPAKLPSQGQEFNGTFVVNGYNSITTADYSILQAVTNLSLISNDDCYDKFKKLLPYEKIVIDDDSNICTFSGASNTCSGDFGGPLSQNGTVVGTVTWTIKPCGASGAPNVYTKVSNFIDWINQTITENS